MSSVPSYSPPRTVAKMFQRVKAGVKERVMFVHSNIDVNNSRLVRCSGESLKSLQIHLSILTFLCGLTEGIYLWRIADICVFC